MRRVLLGVVSLAAFTGILVAAFWGSGPAEKKPVAGRPAVSGEAPAPKIDETPKRPPSLLGAEAVPGPEDEWRGARVGVEGRKALQELDAEVSNPEVGWVPGPSRILRYAEMEVEMLWGTKKDTSFVSDTLPWIVAVEEAPDSPKWKTSTELVTALRDFDASFRARFKSLFDAHPPGPDWVAPIIVLSSRDEYLRRAKPPAFAISHTNLHSGWAFLSRGNRELAESAIFEATWQTWIALARVRAPREGIPTDSLAAWFWDGTGEYWSAARRDEAGHFHPGEGDSRNAADVRAAVREKKLKPLLALLAATFGDLDASPDPRAAFAVRSQGWAFVAFLETSEGGKRRELLDRYAEKELSGKGGIEAAKECFGDLDWLDRDYEAFVRRLK